MATNVTYDSFDIQSATVISNKIQHTDYAGRAIQRRRKTRDDGFDILENYFTERIIVIRGVVKGSSESVLDTNIDNLKENLSGEEKNLDIDFGGSTRRYIATVRELRIPEEFYNLTVVPYEVEFVCQPFGRNTSTTNHSDDANTSSPFTGSLNVAGNAAPKPKITLLINSLTSISVIEFKNTTTNESIKITRTFVASDSLVIDTDAKTVKVNGTEVDFSGVFPAFVIDTNNYEVTVTGSGFNIDLDIDYLPLFL